MAEVFDHEGMNRITVFAALALLEEDAVEEELLSCWPGCDIAHTAAKSVNNLLELSAQRIAVIVDVRVIRSLNGR